MNLFRLKYACGKLLDPTDDDVDNTKVDDDDGDGDNDPTSSSAFLRPLLELDVVLTVDLSDGDVQ